MAYNPTPYDRPPPYAPSEQPFTDIGKAPMPPQQAYSQPLQHGNPYPPNSMPYPPNSMPYPPNTAAYSQPPMSPPTTNVIVVQSPDVIQPGHCARCRVGVLQKQWPTCCGVCWAICCFPCGLICCCTMSKTRCSHCGATYS